MTILDLTLRDALRFLAGGLFVAVVFWLPVIVHLWQQKP